MFSICVYLDDRGSITDPVILSSLHNFIIFSKKQPALHSPQRLVWKKYMYPFVIAVLFD